MTPIHLKFQDLVLLFCSFYLGATLVLGNEILALHKIAYQSSTKVPADLAVDGGLSQHYFHGSCTHTSDYEIAAGTYWEVDLCGKAFIHHVTIYNREDCCGDRLRDVELYIGNERRSYRLVGFHKGVVGSVYTFELENDVFGQWVRITRIPSVIDILALCEDQVFGYKLQYFRISANQMGADILSSRWTASMIHCAHTCFKTTECKAAKSDEDTQMCFMMASVSDGEDDTGTMMITY